MSLLRVTLFMFIGAMIQSSLPHWALAGSLDWPILTCTLMVTVLHAERGVVLFAATLAGLLYDALSPAPLGISLPYFMLLGIGLYMLKTELFADHPITYCILGLLAVSLKTLWFFIVFSLADLRPVVPGLLIVRLLGGLLLGTLTAPVVFLTVTFFMKTLKKERGRRI